MAISEENRHHLYKRLEQVLGPEEATVLMEHLPPVGWADVAPKRDLDALETRIDRQFEGMEFQFTEVDRRFDELDRRFDRMEHQLADIPREFRSLLISVMSVMAVLFATMMVAVGAAIKI